MEQIKSYDHLKLLVCIQQFLVMVFQQRQFLKQVEISLEKVVENWWSVARNPIYNLVKTDYVFIE
jgi:hypothetical protein